MSLLTLGSSLVQNINSSKNVGCAIQFSSPTECMHLRNCNPFNKTCHLWSLGCKATLPMDFNIVINREKIQADFKQVSVL